MNDDEEKLFREAMKGVRPLKKTSVVREMKALVLVDKISLKPKRHELSSHERKLPQIELSDYDSPSVEPETFLFYAESSISQRMLKQFKKGQIPYQAKLDLHGLTIEKAKEKLVEFIQQQLYKNNRCVLVIHGKGAVVGRESILKSKVNHWLRQTPSVLAFTSAMPQDGGTGAMYVLLKRHSLSC